MTNPHYVASEAQIGIIEVVCVNAIVDKHPDGDYATYHFELYNTDGTTFAPYGFVIGSIELDKWQSGKYYRLELAEVEGS